MNYIINPWWFYLIDVIDTIDIVVYILSIIFGIICTVLLLIYISSSIDGEGFGPSDPDVRRAKVIKKPLKIVIIIFIITILLVIFLPSKEVLVQMQIAKFATYENAEWTVEAIKNATDYIIEAFKELK